MHINIDKNSSLCVHCGKNSRTIRNTVNFSKQTIFMAPKSIFSLQKECDLQIPNPK